MTRAATYRHEFVDAFPRDPAAGVLYVSLPFATTMHLCMCGCGNDVVAPLDPTDWTAHFDGRTVSLTPSVGSWSLRCQAHYVLLGGKVRWARRWTQSEIDAGRACDRTAKERAYGGTDGDAPLADSVRDTLKDDPKWWDKWF